MARVYFSRGRSSKFKNLSKDPDTLYFVEDTGELYLGSKRFGFGKDVTVEVSGEGNLISDIIWDKSNKILTIVKGDISNSEITQLIEETFEEFHQTLRNEVDNKLSPVSKNPVQNKVIYNEIQKIRRIVPKIFFNTKEDWDAQSDLISESETLYVYTECGDPDPVRIKFGDGSSYLIDMPFTDDGFSEHVMNELIHVSEEDRLRWNDKVRCYVPDPDSENIIFTTN